MKKRKKELIKKTQRLLNGVEEKCSRNQEEIQEGKGLFCTRLLRESEEIKVLVTVFYKLLIIIDQLRVDFVKYMV